MRVLRLLPKVSVATTIVTATTAPASADRTGTLSGCRPGSRAKRTPTTAVNGRPALATRRAALELVGTPKLALEALRWNVRRRATTVARIARQTTIVTSPRPSTLQSKENPRLG